MENRSHALLAGLFTLILGISAAAALWWFGGKQEETRQYLVTTRKTISGLNQQAIVRYRGIRVGKVESIELDPRDVRTTLILVAIRKDIPVTRSTIAKLGFQGVTGIAHILLEESGNDETPIVAGAGDIARIPLQDSLFQELADVGGDTLRGARDFLSSANQVMNEENRRNLTNALANLDAATGNAREMTAQLNQLLTPENVRLFHSTLVRADQAAGQAGTFFSEARGLVTRLQTVSERLETTLAETADGAGTLVPRLNELTSELSTSSRHLNRVLQMLEDSPQSLIFGHSKGLPGPGERGYVGPADGKGKP